MGCKSSTTICEAKQLPPPELPPTYNNVSESLSNYSLESSDESDIQSIQVGSMDVLKIADVYNRYKELKGLTNQMPLYCIRIVKQVVEVLSLPENFLDMILLAMETQQKEVERFRHDFGMGCHYNTSTLPEHNKYSIEHRMVLHNMYKVQLHKMLLNYFENGKEKKAYHILSLIALNHAVMKISPNALQSIEVGALRAMLNQDLATDEELTHVIYYLTTVYNYVAKAVEKWKNKKSAQKEFLAMRYNYRAMKKLKVILLSFRKSLAKPLAQLDAHLAVVNAAAIIQPVSSYDDEEDWKTSKEKWKITGWLKKGYKYRHVPKEMILVKARNVKG